MEVVYQGEHLGIGNLGHAAVVISFTASILGVIAYYFSARIPDSDQWKRLARFTFFIHALAVLTIVASLFYIIHSHYFEYHYAWQHSSLSLPVHYMISCFWEGQEGSFLLWIFWHVVIGIALLRTSRTWESPVMAVIMLAQVVLTSMLLGVNILGLKIGSSPFVLLRETMANAPIFQQAGYLSFIKDGNGLNPLLQNYWMVIHPPTLFFGFAATVVPFAYAMAGLWTGRYKEWIRPALPWSLIAVMILGTGIIMGGFWAYESLSFGGYWAWDPVENASLIPWLILIAGVHVMLVSKSTGKSLGLTFVLIISTFLLVLYATFLTRSGVLGDSSVHSFTDLGLSGQLLILLFLFISLPPFVIAKDNRVKAGIVVVYLLFAGFLLADVSVAAKILGALILISSVVIPVIYNPLKEPGKQVEDNLSSREFWMFIGSLVLLISAFQVLIATSLPAYNKLELSEKKLAIPTEAVAFYNQWQLPIAVIIALLTAITQFFKYKQSPREQLLRHIGISLGIAIVLTGAAAVYFHLSHFAYITLLFAGVYGIVGNLYYLFSVSGKKLSFAGASIAHTGFGLLLVGVLVSSANKQVISYNNVGRDIFGGDDEKTRKENYENMLLALHQPVQMGEYTVTYVGDSVSPPDKFFKIHYKRTDTLTGKLKEEFYLYPNAQNNPKMGFVANPDTRHYLTRDIFTHVNFDPSTQEKEDEPFINNKTHKVKPGDTIYTENAVAVLEKIDPGRSKDLMPDADVYVAAELKVIGIYNTYYAEPVFAIKGKVLYPLSDAVDEVGLNFRFISVVPEENAFVIETSERKPRVKYVVMKAIVFPFINFVWAGTIIMVIGFFISIVRRVKEYRALARNNKA